MKPVNFLEQNAILGAPEGQEATVLPLPVHTNGEVCVSLWELTDDDIIHINREGKLYLFVYSGQSQPPVWLETKNPFTPPTEESYGAAN